MVGVRGIVGELSYKEDQKGKFGLCHVESYLPAVSTLCHKSWLEKGAAVLILIYQ
jgi:hypothetical protein